jgi:hypothetical protein
MNVYLDRLLYQIDIDSALDEEAADELYLGLSKKMIDEQLKQAIEEGNSL